VVTVVRVKTGESVGVVTVVRVKTGPETNGVDWQAGAETGRSMRQARRMQRGRRLDTQLALQQDTSLDAPLLSGKPPRGSYNPVLPGPVKHAFSPGTGPPQSMLFDRFRSCGFFAEMIHFVQKLGPQIRLEKLARSLAEQALARFETEKE
jgi:hypothetical protein